MKLLLLIIFLTISPLLQAQCDQVYADRADFALKINEDLDIGDEYHFEKPLKVTNKKVLTLIQEVGNKLRFSDSKETNKLIQYNLSRKTTTALVVHPLRFLLYGGRKAYLIKEPLNEESYYSFIIYLDEDCQLQ